MEIKVFHCLNFNEKEMLEEFDERIVKTGMKKESSDANAATCDLDPEYVERFRRIIKNMR